MNYTFMISLFLFLLTISPPLFAQHNSVDSLNKELSIMKDSHEKMQTLVKLAKAYRASDIEQSFHYASKAVDLAKAMDNKEIIIQSYLIIAEIHWKQTAYKSAFDFATKAKDLAISENLDVFLAEAILIIGNIYTEIGDYEKNSELFFQALEIFEKTGNKKGIAHAYISIAAFYFEKDNHEKALEYATKSLSLSKELNDLNGIARALNNIGTIYGYIEDYEKEELYYRESIEIAKKLEWDLELAIIYLNLGEVYFKMSRIEASFDYYDKAYEILNRIQNIKFIAQLHLLRSLNYKSIKAYEKSRAAAIKALNIGQKNNMKKIIYEAAATLHQLHREQNNTREAYRYALLQFEMKDSLNLESGITKLMLQDIKYNYEKELQELKTKQQLKEYNYLVITIAITALLIITIILLIFRQKIKTKNNILAKKELELDIDRKNRELTSATMSLLDTNKKLTEIGDSLIRIKEQTEKQEVKSALQGISNKIEQSTKSNTWKEFEFRFKQVHNSFYDNLLERYPNLTPNDLRLCSLLKLNLTTKEISELTGQRGPSIEIARSRLRKKLGITNRNTSLIIFLSQF